MAGRTRPPPELIHGPGSPADAHAHDWPTRTAAPPRFPGDRPARPVTPRGRSTACPVGPPNGSAAPSRPRWVRSAGSAPLGPLQWAIPLIPRHWGHPTGHAPPISSTPPTTTDPHPAKPHSATSTLRPPHSPRPDHPSAARDARHRRAACLPPGSVPAPTASAPLSLEPEPSGPFPGLPCPKTPNSQEKP